MSKGLESKIATAFQAKFRTEPVIIASPGRINIIGEHTDYNEGFVFPAAIDKKIVLAIAASSNLACEVVAFDFKESYTFLLDQVAPVEKGSWKNYVLGVIYEIQQLGYDLKPFNMVFGGDIPGGAGLSSSAALENAIVFGINELFQLGLSREDMIFIAQRAEHNYVGVKCGIMDQYASMFGQKDQLMLLDCRTIEAKAFPLNLKSYELLLINTNVKHSLSDSAYNDRRAVCERTAAMLGKQALRDVSLEELETIKAKVAPEDFQKALYVIQEIERTQQASNALMKGDLMTLGNLIYQSHEGLSNQYKVSCEELDFLVEMAKENKAVIGARMMGGGFGGCTINLIEKSETVHFIAKVSRQYKEAFNKECSVYQVKVSDGTTRIDN